MKKIISPIEISYKGSDADIHIVNAQALGESIIGVSKLYTAVAHYCSYGLVPERREVAPIFWTVVLGVISRHINLLFAA